MQRCLRIDLDHPRLTFLIRTHLYRACHCSGITANFHVLGEQVLGNYRWTNGGQFLLSNDIKLPLLSHIHAVLGFRSAILGISYQLQQRANHNGQHFEVHQHFSFDHILLLRCCYFDIPMRLVPWVLQRWVF